VDRSEWAFQLRVGLVEAIAHRTWAPRGEAHCVECWDVYVLEDLEVDHKLGRTWYGRSLNFLDRIRRLWRKYDRGVQLRALCKSCNSRDGRLRFRGRPRWRR
jgi:hypothetical protein